MSLPGQVPIDIALRESGDVGRPLTASDPNGVIGKVFKEIAYRIVAGPRPADQARMFNRK